MKLLSKFADTGQKLITGLTFSMTVDEILAEISANLKI
jgi:hypothetical protein